MTLSPKCCSSKAVPCPFPNPNPDKMLSKSIFRGLLLHGINLRIMRTELKMVIVIVNEVSFDEMSRTVWSLVLQKSYGAYKIVVNKFLALVPMSWCISSHEKFDTCM